MRRAVIGDQWFLTKLRPLQPRMISIACLRKIISLWLIWKIVLDQDNVKEYVHQINIFCCISSYFAKKNAMTMDGCNLNGGQPANFGGSRPWKEKVQKWQLWIKLFLNSNIWSSSYFHILVTWTEARVDCVNIETEIDRALVDTCMKPNYSVLKHLAHEFKWCCNCFGTHVVLQLWSSSANRYFPLLRFLCVTIPICSLISSIIGCIH